MHAGQVWRAVVQGWSLSQGVRTSIVAGPERRAWQRFCRQHSSKTRARVICLGDKLHR